MKQLKEEWFGSHENILWTLKKKKKNPVAVLMLSMQQVKNKDKNSMQW